MDLRGLRLYLAVLEHGSITKASETVHVAQPALGLHIRKLEEELGLTLLERHSRGIRATEAGSLLARHAAVLLRYADQAKEEMTSYSKVPSGNVRIGLTPTAREAVAVTLVEQVSKELPAVQLTVKEALSEMLVKFLLDGRLDAALVYNTRVGGEQLAFEPLASEAMYFVYPLSQGRRPGDTITLAEAMSHRLILPTQPHMVRTEIDRLAMHLGVRPDIVHEVDSMAAIRDFVGGGLGCSVMPRGAVRNPSYTTAVGSQMVVEPTIKRLLHLAYSRNRSISKAFEATIDVLKRVVDDEMKRPDSQWERLEPQRRVVRAISPSQAASC